LVADQRAASGTAEGHSVRDVTHEDLERAVAVRRRLLAAAREAFLAEGVMQASLEGIAERAGVDLVTLQSIYPTRHDLMSKVAGRLYTEFFPFGGGWRHRTDLRAFMRAYLQRQQRPDVRLIWYIGDQLATEFPDRIDAAYWHLAGELELRLRDGGLDDASAHECSMVLTPALMLVARRAAFDLTTQAEVRDFVTAACRLAERAGAAPATPSQGEQAEEEGLQELPPQELPPPRSV
jgi:AcrR family transcriptional regulator